MLRGEDLKERSNFCLKIEFFHFFKNLVWHVAKLRHHKDYGTRGKGLMFSFEIDDLPICITIDVPVIVYSS